MPAPAQNYVSPDDVGKRVTFQFELPNGYVGEAVGTLEAYDRALALKPDHALALKWRTTCVRHVEREADG